MLGYTKNNKKLGGDNLRTPRANLITLRKEKSLLQKDIVAILNSRYGIEITESYYGMIEQGVRTPSLEIALGISEIFKVDPQDIFFTNRHNKKLGKVVT
jgi:putative transcriptional regulator